MSDEEADKQDITEMLVRYSTGIDTRDWGPRRHVRRR
jgi:hypothetical protein